MVPFRIENGLPWMLQPDAVLFRLSEQIEHADSALQALVDALYSCEKVTATNQPEQSHAANHTRTR
jgi:hypothetical protein